MGTPPGADWGKYLLFIVPVLLWVLLINVQMRNRKNTGGKSYKKGLLYSEIGIFLIVSLLILVIAIDF